MTSWQIYWLTRLDNIQNALRIVVMISFIASTMIAIFWSVYAFDSYREDDEDSKKEKALRGIFIRMIIIPICFGILLVSTPSSKEMAAIIIVPKLTNAISKNQKIMNLPDKVLDLANAWIEELGPKKAEKQ